jgi:hypothetical protein
MMPILMNITRNIFESCLLSLCQQNNFIIIASTEFRQQAKTTWNFVKPITNNKNTNKNI